MRYPIVIEPGDGKTAHGVIVPDLPGCFSAGDTLDDALAAAEEAVAAWIDAAMDSGQPIPPPSSLDTALDDKTERVNITLPRRVLRRLDAIAQAAGESRSGTIAQLTLLRDPRAARP